MPTMSGIYIERSFIAGSWLALESPFSFGNFDLEGPVCLTASSNMFSVSYPNLPFLYFFLPPWRIRSYFLTTELGLLFYHSRPSAWESQHHFVDHSKTPRALQQQQNLFLEFKSWSSLFTAMKLLTFIENRRQSLHYWCWEYAVFYSKWFHISGFEAVSCPKRLILKAKWL